MWIGVAGVAVLAFGLISGRSAEFNPYQKIPERNVFGLRPIVPPPAPRAEAPALPKVTLTGITTILGNKRALLQVSGHGKTNEFYILTEGQAAGQVQVLRIDERRGVVTVRNHGTEQLLTFDQEPPKSLAKR